MAKITKANTAPLGLYQLKDLPKGEYVKRVELCEVCDGKGRIFVQGAGYSIPCACCDGKGYAKVHGKVYIKGDYCRSGMSTAGKYALTDFEDANREIFRRGSVLVLAGFTF